MSAANEPRPARILLAIGEAEEHAAATAVAARLASRFAAPVECIVVTQDDLLAAAALPFTRAVGLGGQSVPVTLERVQEHFRRLAESVERDLLEHGRRSSLPWRVEQRAGSLPEHLQQTLDRGDLVVIGRRDLRPIGDGALETLRRLLLKASAVIVPSRQMPRQAPPLMPEAEETADLALRLAAALGVSLPGSAWRQAALIAARLDELEAEGEAAFFRRLAASGAGAVILPRPSARDQDRSA